MSSPSLSHRSNEWPYMYSLWAPEAVSGVFRHRFPPYFPGVSQR